MKKILIDTNVVLDFALQRNEFGEAAKKLILFIAHAQIKSYVTASSVTDIYYVLRKAKGHDDAIGFLKSFINITKITGVNEEIIIEALHSNIKDFEDAVQIKTAGFNGLEIIITRDKKGYENSGLKIFSPTEYLGESKSF